MKNVIKMLTLSLIAGAFLCANLNANTNNNDAANTEAIALDHDNALNLDESSSDNFDGIGRGWAGLGLYGLMYGIGYSGWGGYGCCFGWGAYNCGGIGAGYYGLGFGGLTYGAPGGCGGFDGIGGMGY